MSSGVDVMGGWKEILLLMLGGFVGSFSKVIDFLENFWKYYNCIENPSYRDQCLWNFIYLKYKYSAFTVKSFKVKYFNGRIKIQRKIKDYIK